MQCEEATELQEHTLQLLFCAGSTCLVSLFALALESWSGGGFANGFTSGVANGSGVRSLFDDGLLVERCFLGV